MQGKDTISFSIRLGLVLSFFRKGILDLPLMILANIVWPMYGLMLVQPFMEFAGSMIALVMYRNIHTGLHGSHFKI